MHDPAFSCQLEGKCVGVAESWVDSKSCQSWRTMSLSKGCASMGPLQSFPMPSTHQDEGGRLLAFSEQHSPTRSAFLCTACIHNWRLLLQDGSSGVLMQCKCFIVSAAFLARPLPLLTLPRLYCAAGYLGLKAAAATRSCLVHGCINRAMCSKPLRSRAVCETFHSNA